MLGWTIVFTLITAISAAIGAYGTGPESFVAHTASIVFGALLAISLVCTLAGRAVRHSLR